MSEKKDNQEQITPPEPTPQTLAPRDPKVRKREAQELQEKVRAEQNAEGEVKIPTRRVRVLMVNPTDFMFLFTKGLVFRKTTKLIEGVPEDAQLIAVAADSVRNGVMLVVQSKEYDEVPMDVLPPVQMCSIDVGVKGATKKKKAPRKKK